MVSICDRHGEILTVPDGPDGDATRRGIRQLEAAQRALERDELALLDQPSDRRDHSALGMVRNELGELRDRLRIAKRRCAAKRLSAYATEPELLDRAAQVEAGCGDIQRHMVDMLVAAGDGDWEAAEKCAKAVASASSRVKSLVADVSAGASRSARTGQTAMAFDEDERPAAVGAVDLDGWYGGNDHE